MTELELRALIQGLPDDLKKLANSHLNTAKALGFEHNESRHHLNYIKDIIDQKRKPIYLSDVPIQKIRRRRI